MNILQQVNSFEIHRSVYINIIRNIREIETNNNLSLSKRNRILDIAIRFIGRSYVDVTRVSILVSLVVRPFICSSNENRAARSFLPSESRSGNAWNGDSLARRRVEMVPHRQGFRNTCNIRPTWPPDVLQWILRLAIVVVELRDRVPLRGLTRWMAVRNVLRFTSCDADGMYPTCKRIETSSYLRGWLTTTTTWPTFSWLFFVPADLIPRIYSNGRLLFFQ